MKYSKVYLNSIGYELAPEVISTSDLEARLDPFYKALRIPLGQVETLTGIQERRWWEKGAPLSQGAIHAAQKALSHSNIPSEAIEVLIYSGVCRENFEPATACRVAGALGISSQAFVYDLSNACLGVLNGILDVANRIELGQIKAGMVVSCESAREINDIMTEKMLSMPDMEMFKYSLATLTGGSGAVAVILSDGSFGKGRRKLLGGTARTAPEHHRLCRWGLEGEGIFQSPFMSTDSISVLKYGVDLGLRTWRAFLKEMGWKAEDVDRVICHQVGSGHQEEILKILQIPKEKDFVTYPYLGNMGTVSLPLTAAIAEEREFLEEGHKVAFLGIGSGLNCLMLGWKW